MQTPIAQETSAYMLKYEHPKLQDDHPHTYSQQSAVDEAFLLYKQFYKQQSQSPPHGGHFGAPGSGNQN